MKIKIFLIFLIYKMVHCKCKTNDGSKCKNVANPDSSHGYCTMHHKKDKMRCVSLARKSVGYHSPKRRPTFPRKSSKSARKSSRRSKSRKSSRK